MLRSGHLAVLCVSIALAHARAQNQAASTNDAVIRTDVRQVVVPVVVLDRQGHHVPRLKASDFQILEDGRYQRIVAFETDTATNPLQRVISSNPVPVPDSHGSAAATASTQGKSSILNTPRRTYLILVDTLHSSFASFNRIRDALGRFFDGERAGDSQFALIALGRQTRIVQDSTSDPAAIMTAVRSKAFFKLIQDSEAVNIYAAVEQFKPLVDAYCGVCRCGSPDAPTTCGDRLYKPQVQGFLNISADRALSLNREFLRELEGIVRATADMPTSRTILFISDGFNRFAGRELYAILQGHGVREGIFTWNWRDTQPELDAVLKIATKYDVKFYTLDSRGLYSEASLPGSGFSAATNGSARGVDSMIRSTARENTDALAELAHQTGGIFYEHDNDLLKGIQQAFADGREFYSLAYVSDNRALDGKYRQIEVKVRGGKWKVNAKAGYWAIPN